MLHEAALPTLRCALEALNHCTDFGRIELLNLCFEIVNCTGEWEESEPGNESLMDRCLYELRFGASAILASVQKLKTEELCWFLPLLHVLAKSDKDLRSRVRWYFEKILLERNDIEDMYKRHIRGYLSELDQSLVTDKSS